MLTTQDPIKTGLVESFARPGGNITGIARLTRELGGKRLELLKEVAPKVSRVGVLFNAEEAGATIALKEYEHAASALKLALQSFAVRGPNPDLENAFQDAVKNRISAIVTITGSLLSIHKKRIIELTVKNRLPAMFETKDYVEVGGLMSYAANDDESFRRAAVYVDKILKGAKPADLPVEQPTKFEFVINLKTAKALNLAIPQSVLFRADRVIK